MGEMKIFSADREVAIHLAADPVRPIRPSSAGHCDAGSADPDRQPSAAILVVPGMRSNGDIDFAPPGRAERLHRLGFRSCQW
jgi:hypothetical protein